jgi:hypothetical protein
MKMPAFPRGFLDRVRRFGRTVQLAIVRFLLVLLYFVGVGPTKLWVLVFHRRLLYPASGDGSAWIPATGHEFDEATSDRQS